MLPKKFWVNQKSFIMKNVERWHNKHNQKIWLNCQHKAKGQISKQVFQKNKAHQYSQKMNISYHKGKKFSFFIFDLLCFLKTPVLRFTLLPYYQQVTEILANFKSMNFIFKVWCIGVKFYYYFGNNVKYRPLSQYFFQRTQQHGSLISPQSKK